MQVSNIKYYPDIPWDDYKLLPGKSFSFLKNDGAEVSWSEGIHIGKLVHTYLLKPNEYNYEDSDIVVPAARKLIEVVPNLHKMESEKGATANFMVDGLCMEWKGLVDASIFGKLVIDFKVLAGDLKYYLDKFLYRQQVRGYMIPMKAPLGVIIAYNKKIKKVQVEYVSQNTDWWEYKIKKYGIPSGIFG